MLKRVGKFLARLHRDERGVVSLEYLLIIAAIALPLLGLIWWYREDIGRWVGQKWDQYRLPAQQDVGGRPSPSPGP